MDALNGGETDFETLISETKTYTDNLREELQNGRDRLVELNSCDHDIATTVIEEIAAAERSEELSGYMSTVFDQFGVSHEPHSDQAYVLHPTEHMQDNRFPGLPDGGITATFDREKALSREDMHYLSWEHPMVSGAMEMITSSEFGNNCICTIKLGPLKPGALLLEAYFMVTVTAPAHLQLGRYLPPTQIRVVLDNGGGNLTEVLKPAHFSKLGQKVKKRTAQDIVRSARNEMNEMIRNAETQAKPQLDTLVTAAKEQVQTALDEEWQRLNSLAKVNPNIRQSELDYVQSAKEDIDGLLGNAQLSLDAIRFAVAV
jgi:ATP-dependent helicase HepA